MSTFKTLNLSAYKAKTSSDDNKFFDKINKYENFIYADIFNKYRNTCIIHSVMNDGKVQWNNHEVIWSCKPNGERGIRFPCQENFFMKSKSVIPNIDFSKHLYMQICKDEKDEIGFKKFRENIKKCIKNKKNFVIIPVGFEYSSVKCSDVPIIVETLNLDLLYKQEIYLKEKLDSLITKKEIIINQQNFPENIREMVTVVENYKQFYINSVYYHAKILDKKFIDSLDNNTSNIIKSLHEELHKNFNSKKQVFESPWTSFEQMINMHKDKSLYLLHGSEKIMKMFVSMKSGHSNIVVYNVEQNEYFRIEPNGSHLIDNWYENEKFDKEFEIKMKEINIRINAVNLTDSCPYLGPQSIGDQDTCILWSYFILEHILLNPKMTALEVQERIIEKYNSQNKLRDIISKYLSSIENKNYFGYLSKRKIHKKYENPFFPFEKEKEEKEKQDPEEKEKLRRKNQEGHWKKYFKLKKVKKVKKVRKHQGIIQTGGNTGRLRKGYRYSGKKLKSGLPQIIKIKKKKIKR